MRKRLGYLGTVGVLLGGSAIAWAIASAVPEGPRPVPSAAAVRTRALARARVFRTDFNSGVLAAHTVTHQDVTCRFLPTNVSGTTPKFDCSLPDGTKVKVKYGGTPEVSGEAAATRLLTALGFPADHVEIASSVRCYGCPPSPFYTRVVFDWVGLSGPFGASINYEAFRDFEWSAVERKLPGEAIEENGREGWGFYELSEVKPDLGGASPADVDALRLMAVFLAHWDNKPANQRLSCPDADARAGDCTRPLLVLQDVGSTFGPKKVDLDAWRHSPIWTDPARCAVSMRHFPYDGGTFVDGRISEKGRQTLARRLSRLSSSEIRTLFTQARFPGSIEEWVAVFEKKVDEITSHPGCSQA